MMKGIYLLLGSNLGDSSKILRDASKRIEASIGKITKFSSVYQTKAWGVEDQPDFLNQVIEIDSSLSPKEILKQINQIEEQMGRIRIKKWHSRIIDIDILYYGSEIINQTDLVIPHKENENRNFVLAPMAEIAPDFIHPQLGLTQEELLKNCKDPLKVTRMKKTGPI